MSLKLLLLRAAICPNLAQIVAAWTSLPEPVRRALSASVG